MKKRNLRNQNLIRIVNPLIPSFKLKDILQVIIGAGILAIPVGLTEEVWILGETLPIINILIIVGITLTFLAMFTYYHYHNHIPKKFWGEFAKRVFFTYFFSFLVVAILMTLIQQAPWRTNLGIAFGRTAIVTLPSSLSATIADTLR